MDQQETTAQAAHPSAPLAPLDSRKQVREVEIYYGKMGLLQEKAETLLHGKPLAKLIAAAAVIAATSLFLFAARL